MSTILEIGAGSTPYFIRYDVPWLLGDAYIALDIDEKRTEDAKVKLDIHKRGGRSHPSEAQFLLYDGTALPFADNSLDHIVLSNVLSAPIHFNWDDRGQKVTQKNASGTFERHLHGKRGEVDLFYAERKPMIQEALRVLRPGGTLSIFTDLIIFGQASYEKLLEEMRHDLALVYINDTEEASRIDAYNKQKLASGVYCFCFDAEVLPRSSVHRFTKIY